MSHEPIKIAILAMGGEGGGVLADWIVNLGEENGYFAQTTSVAGVAQRTGATVYYVELFPGANAATARMPVLAQAPLAGDVDIVLASELMEAGRAVQRGFVTRDRTTLIASSHRVYSIGEKMAMGDGRVDAAVLTAQARHAAKRFVSFDMQEAADRSGSVVSAVLFGALSGSGVLPFNRSQYEETIVRGGVGIKQSLKAFEVGYVNARQCLSEDVPAVVTPAGDAAVQVQATHPQVIALIKRSEKFSAPAREIVIEGIRRLIDYQDVAYAGLYLDRLEALPASPSGEDGELLRETARHLALWMSYEDTIRVAQLKIRSSRFQRVRGEVRSTSEQVLEIEEYMHPRVEEVCETLPAGIGRWLSRPHAVHRAVARLTQDGRTIRTSSLPGFLLLYALSGWRRWRRSTLRATLEHARIEAWLHRLRQLALVDPALALETAKCQRLVKGYGDTHARGLKNYEALMRVVDRYLPRLAPTTLRELRDAALADEYGHALHEALRRHDFSLEDSLP